MFVIVGSRALVYRVFFFFFLMDELDYRVFSIFYAPKTTEVNDGDGHKFQI